MITKIKNLVMKNWMAKLFCLLFALSLWAWVKIQQTAEVRIDVQVSFRGLPDEFVITGDSDKVVSVTLSGPKTTLNRMEPSQVSVEIDASQFEPGENSVRILPWNLEYPRGLNVESIQPPRVNVLLERRISKEVDVDPNVSEGPPEGFEYEAIPKPDTAVIHGAEETLSELDEIELEPINLSERDTGFVQSGVQAEFPDDVRLEQPPENEFTVEFEIYEPVVTRTISGVNVTILDVPEGRTGVVEPSQIRLDIRGPKRTIEDVEPSDIVAEVRAPQDNEPIIREARISLPSGVELAGGQPDRRTVRVRLLEEQ